MILKMTTAGTCPICKIRPADSREHVWPHWFLKRMDAHAAPKGSWAVNGEPILDRDDVQYAGRAQRERVMLDICATCNNELDRRFEKPAKGLVDVLAINEWAGPFTQDEWLTVGLWWTKLLLLLGLPEARYATPRIDEQIIVRHDEPQALDLRWLTDGSPPPSELSLYIHNVDLANQEIVHTIPIPHIVVEPDGGLVHFHLLQLASTGACLTLLSHPGWPVKHPFVADGTGWELLHSPPPTGSDLSALPFFGRTAIHWATFAAHLKPGHALGSGLPPLRPTPDALTPDPDVFAVLDGYLFDYLGD